MRFFSAMNRCWTGCPARIIAASGVLLTLSAVPVSADEAFHLNGPAIRGGPFVMTSQTGRKITDSQDTPIVLAPAKLEGTQSSAAMGESPSRRHLPDEVLLLQDAGPIPTNSPVVRTKDPGEATSVNVFTGVGYASPDNYKPLTGKERWRYYFNQNFISAGAYVGPVLSAVIDQVNGQPPEWGGGMQGYGKRVASRLGTGIVQGTTQSTACALLGQDPRYIRSSSTSILGRAGHAFAFGLLTYNNEGKVRIAFATLASYYVSSMSTNAWLPDRYSALGDGVRDGNRQVILAGLVNQFQEFWPDIKRIVFRRH